MSSQGVEARHGSCFPQHKGPRGLGGSCKSSQDSALEVENLNPKDHRFCGILLIKALGPTQAGGGGEVEGGGFESTSQ